MQRDRDYWAAYHAERVRFDRKKCSTGYNCGATCIPLRKECNKKPRSSLAMERLRKIEAIAFGDAPEVAGIQGLKKGEAAALGLDIYKRRNAKYQEIKAERDRQIEERKAAKGWTPAPSLSGRFASSPNATLTAKKFDEAFDALERLGGETAQNVRSMREFFAERGGAIAFGSGDSVGWIAESEAIRESLKRSEAEAAADFNMRGSSRIGGILYALDQYRIGRPSPDAIAQASKLLPMKRADGHYWAALNMVTIKDIGTQKIDYAPEAEQMKERVMQTLSKYKLASGVGFPEGSGVSRYEAMIITTIHEIGHMVHFKGSSRSSRRADDYGAAPGEVLKERAPSRYGKTDQEERFAEAFVGFVVAPEALKKTRPATYEWVKSTLERARE